MSEQTPAVREALAVYAPEAPETERVPQGYKQTEVGVIPDGWEITTLGEIGDCLIGLTYTPSNVKPDGLLVLRASNIGSGGLQFEDNVFVDVDVPEKLLVRNDDILICVRSGSRELIGKSILIDERAKGMTFGAFMSVFRSPHNWYVFYQFQSEIVKQQIHARLGATINQITNSSLNSFYIPLPDKREQRVIAAALSDVDALISALDRLISKKRAVKTAAMQQLLTGKQRLPGFGYSEHWKRTAIGNLPSGWSCYSVQALTIRTEGAIKIGPFGSQLKREYLTSSGYKVYGQENVFEKDMSIGSRFIDRERFKELQSCEVRSRDFLISMMGTVGKCMIVPEGIHAGIMDSHLLRLRLDEEKIHPQLLLQLFASRVVLDQVKKLSVGGIMEGLSSSILKNVLFPLPTVEEQTAIAGVLSDMDAEIKALEARREKTRRVKQGMMQELLTGRTRLV